MLLQVEQVEHLLKLGYRPWLDGGGVVMPGPRAKTWMSLDRWETILRWLETPEDQRGRAASPAEAQPWHASQPERPRLPEAFKGSPPKLRTVDLSLHQGRVGPPPETRSVAPPPRRAAAGGKARPAEDVAPLF